MEQTLKQKALSGTKWSSILQFGRYGISFFLSIVLARLLAPEEFGLIGMLSIFSAIALVFINSGLSTAIIRTKDATPDDYTTVFYFNVAVSVFFYVVLFFTAPIIAKFYNEPRLVLLTRLITLVFLFNAFGIVQKAILVKAINFKKQTICVLSGIAVSAIVAAYMAFKGYGVYAIVGQAISQAVVTNILFWVTSDWRPSGRFKKKSFLKLWSFGSKVLATNIVAKVVDNIDNILIGKVFSAGQLGYYVRAKSTKQIPELIVTSVFNVTSFAVLAKVGDNPLELKRLHIRFFQFGAFIIFPIIFGLIASAESFVVVIYSEKWLPSVQILQILALTSIPIFLGALFSQTIKVIGDGGLYFKLTSLKKVLGLLSIPFGLFFGLTSFVIAFVFLHFVGLLLDFYFCGKQLNIKVYAYIKYLFKPTFISLLMGCVVYSIILFNIDSYLLTLLIQIIVGLIVYIILSRILLREFFNEMHGIIKVQIDSILNKFKTKKH